MASMTCREDLQKLYPAGTNIVDISGSSKENHTCTVRLKCSSKEEFNKWLNAHELLSGVTFRVLFTRPRVGKTVIYKATYRCHHNTNPRKKVKSPSKKHTGCQAKVTVTIKSSTKGRKVRSMDVLRAEYPTIVTLVHEHNHLIDIAEATKYKDPTEETKNKFLNLFKSHHGPARALYLHKQDLQQDYEDEYFKVAADRSLCPDIKWVTRLYNTEFKNKFVNLEIIDDQHEDHIQNKDNGNMFVVNDDIGMCSCPVGQEGAPCKHQHLISTKLHVSCKNTIPICTEDKLRYHWVATGSKDVPDNWYQPLNNLEDNTTSRHRQLCDDTHKDVLKSDIVLQDIVYNTNSKHMTLEDMHIMFKGCYEKLEKYFHQNPERISVAIEKACGTFMSLNTESSLTSALHNFGKTTHFSINRKKNATSIVVQPTAVSRRKCGIKGRRCLQSGRPAKKRFVGEHAYSKMKGKKFYE